MALPDHMWPEPDDELPAARVVRAYTLTAGRTKPRVDLPVEAELRRKDSSGPSGLDGHLGRILDMCDSRSVAEVSALVSMPIGVVRVLLADLVELGLVQVQATLSGDSSYDERRDLIERTLRGLRTL